MSDTADDICQHRIIHLDKIETARNNALTEKEIEALSQLFKALADPTRLKILQALTTTEMCVCDLAAYAGVSESAISHQLRILRTMDLVSNRRSGPVLYYTLADQHVSELIHIALEHNREKP